MLRIKHYFKNLLVFVPLFFSGNIFNAGQLKVTFVAFVAFCLTSSAVYIINDICDVRQDRLHQVKCQRPIASGAVKLPVAGLTAFVFLFFAAACLLLFVKENVFVALVFLFIYLAINVLYSLGLKNVPIIDVCILSFGFILRILFGGAVSCVVLSDWIILTVIAATLFMSFGKRRGEYKKSSSSTRKVLKEYSYSFLDKSMYVCLTLCMAFYGLWAVDTVTMQRVGSSAMVWTVPLVMVILFRYCLMIEKDCHADPVDTLYADKPLMALVGVYILAMAFLLY